MLYDDSDFHSTFDEGDGDGSYIHKHNRRVALRWFSVIALTIAICVGVTVFDNASERAKCRSLSVQGVRAYVAHSFLADECVVIGREIQVGAP